MNLLLNEDQREFQRTLRALFEKQSESQRVRAVQAAGDGFDRETWASLVKLGATTTLIAEEYDGLGLGLTEASIVLEEAGRVIAPVPIYTAVLATAAIRATNDAALQAELLPKIASGETLVALAFTEAADSWIPVRASVTADGAGAVTGTKSFVRDAQFADDLLVLTDGSAAWFNGQRIDNPNTHGTGCTLSSAIASNLAKGYDLETAVRRAKAYISGALAAMLDLGHGSGPMNHAFALDNEWSKEAEA